MNPFEKSVDQTRLNRLRGAIVAFVSDYEQDGYDNMEIARALIWASLHRMEHENSVIAENYYTWVRDFAAQILAREQAVVSEFLADKAAKKIN